MAGPFYLVVGLVQVLTHDRFDLTSHALSLLMPTDWGWVQRLILILAGGMVLAAAWGFARAMDRPAAAVALASFGVAGRQRHLRTRPRGRIPRTLERGHRERQRRPAPFF